MARIPTKGKDKLPRGWSYPIGGEQVSSALAEIPQYGVLNLSFRRHPTLFASEIARAVKALQPIPVLRAGYRHLRPIVPHGISPIADDYYDEAWELEVYAVPATQRSDAASALMASPDGFNRIRAWFGESRSQIWREGQKYLWLTFDLGAGGLDAIENRTWRWRVLT